MNKLLAQVGKPLGNEGIGGEGLGPFGNKNYSGSGETALKDVTNIVSTIIGVMTIAAVIWFMFMFIIGGFNWITSKGDKAKLEQARGRITNGLIGLILVVAAWAIVGLIGVIFGWEQILLKDPGVVLDTLIVN